MYDRNFLKANRGRERQRQEQHVGGGPRIPCYADHGAGESDVPWKTDRLAAILESVRLKEPRPVGGVPPRIITRAL